MNMPSRITIGLAILLSLFPVIIPPSGSAEVVCGAAVGEPLARFNGNFKERGVDEDGDKLFEMLEVEIEIEGALTSDAWVSATLKKSGRELFTTLERWVAHDSPHDMAENSAHIPGNHLKLQVNQRHLVRRRFPTSWLRALREDGPYDASFTISSRCSLGPHPLFVSVPTRSYKFTEFPQSEVSLRFKEAGPLDVEGDGKPDGLWVGVRLESPREMVLNVRAKLLGSRRKGDPDYGNFDHTINEDDKSHIPFNVLLRPGVPQTVVLTFLHRPYNQRGQENLSFSKLEIVASDVESGKVTMVSNEVKLSSAFAFNGKPLYRRGMRNAETSIRGLDINGDGYYDEWIYDIRLLNMRPGRHQGWFFLLAWNGSKHYMLASEEQECATEDRVCTFSAKIPNSRLFLHFHDRKSLGVGGQVFLFDEKKLIPIADNFSLTDEQLDRSQPPDSEPVFLFERFSNSFESPKPNDPPGMLTIRGNVIVQKAGEYVFNGHLATARSNQHIGFFETRLHLEPGRHEVPLSIPIEKLKGFPDPYSFEKCSFFLAPKDANAKPIAATTTCVDTHTFSSRSVQ